MTGLRAGPPSAGMTGLRAGPASAGMAGRRAAPASSVLSESPLEPESQCSSGRALLLGVDVAATEDPATGDWIIVETSSVLISSGWRTPTARKEIIVFKEQQVQCC